MDFFVTSVLARTALLAVIFIAVVGAVVIGWSIASRRAALQRRLQLEAHTGGGMGGPSLRWENDQASAWAKIVRAIEARGLSLTDTKASKIKDSLAAAGYTSTYAPQIFTLVRLVLTLLVPLAFIVLSLNRPEPPSFMKLYVISAGLAVMGLYLPNLWVRARADRRREEITNGFPDALDLMLVCVEAGLGIESSFDRVAREMARSHPLVSELMGGVVLEMRAGRSREEALHRMADKARIDEIQSFSTLVVQSEKLGASIGQALRVYAGEMRERRRMRAEEKAHRLPVLLSIPLVACMLPVMIGVLMLPAAIRVIRQIVPILGGG